MNEKIIEVIEDRFSKPTVSAVMAAMLAGQKIRTGDFGGHDQAVEKENFRSIVTPADKAGQDFILDEIHKNHPEARFLAEEKTEKHSHLLLSLNKIHTEYTFNFQGLRFDVDAIDGTTMQALGLPEWSVAIAVWYKRELLTGVIYMPEIRGGTVVAGEVGRGVIWLESDGAIERKLLTQDTKILYWGADLDLVYRFNRIKNFLARANRRLLVANSGSMALAMVACGIADGVVQDHQAIWDITPGMAILKALGGSVILYRYKNGPYELLDDLDEESYKINGKGVRRTALIATRNSGVARSIFDELRKVSRNTR